MKPRHHAEELLNSIQLIGILCSVYIAHQSIRILQYNIIELKHHSCIHLYASSVTYIAPYQIQYSTQD